MRLTDKRSQIYLNELITGSTAVKKLDRNVQTPTDEQPEGNPQEFALRQFNLDKLLKDNSFTGLTNSEHGVGFVKDFENFCLENKILQRGEKILLGVSAGSDSIAMLLCFCAIRIKYALNILAVHVNYHLRGGESDEDAVHIKTLCEKKNVLLQIVDKKSQNESEDSLRRIRHRVFRRIAFENKIKTIALAHNKNDQVETVLMNFLRGAFFKGLGGIRPKTKRGRKLILTHPMLTFYKKQINEFLDDQNTTWREDISNYNPKYSRNYLRNELIPQIRENLNQNIDQQLVRTSKLFEENDKFWEKSASIKSKRYLIKGLSTEGISYFPVHKLLNEPTILRFYFFKRIFTQMTQTGKDFYYGNFMEIENILHSNGSKRVQLPHEIVVVKEYNHLIFEANKDFVQDNKPTEPFVIPRPLRFFTYDNARISMIKKRLLPADFEDDKNTAYFDFKAIEFPIIVRHYYPGDTFEPIGMSYRSKKIKKFFIDEKIPRFERNKVLIFSDAKKVIWIAGYRLAEGVVASSKSKSILKIKVEQIEQSRSVSRKNRG